MSLPDLPFVTAHANDLLLNVYVQPRASKNQLCGIQGEELKLRLTSPPVDGAANKMCREFFAALFAVAKSSVELVAGEQSRHKRIRICGQHPEQFTTRLTALKEALLSDGHHH